MLGLKPIKLLPARERVASALRKAIIAQQIKEGETLTLETTAQQLGVSITPVREAFQILERDGLISLQQNRGATVLGINEKTLRENGRKCGIPRLSEFPDWRSHARRSTQNRTGNRKADVGKRV